MNEIIINNIVYKIESHWRCSKTDKSKDMRGKLFLYPIERPLWTGLQQFVDKLIMIQEILDHKSNDDLKTKCKDCLICGKKNITTQRYLLNGIVWENGLMHYITKHGIKPSEYFMDMIYKYKIDQKRLPLRISGRIHLNENIKYIKLNRNQLLILDALLKHGGYTKKYADKKKPIYRYSEHAGLLDFNNHLLERVIVSGNTTRIDRGDEEIYLPNDLPEISQFEYIFHTHPPTPKPGGRATDGILYEFPSLGDLLHFIDHFNEGKIIGSLIMTSEGLYNIRKIEFSKDNIVIDEDQFYKEMKKKFREVQEEYIKKYKTHFNNNEFYSKIAQDKTAIEKVNISLEKYGLIIEFYPRVRDEGNHWIVDTIYLPVF